MPNPSHDETDHSLMSIVKRDINFGIGDTPSPRWCDNNEVRTAIFDAFSLFLPEGERFFIRSVHAYLNDITDERLREDVRAFSAQEAYHTREHEAYNNGLRQEGLSLEDINKDIKKFLGGIKNNLERLSVTVGLEHLTACLGYVTLKHPEILSQSDPRYKDLWTWHALEELEHKAVAFEVFQLASSKLPNWQAYLLRCGAMLIVTRHFTRMHFNLTLKILRARKHRMTWKTNLAIRWALWGRPGYFRRIFWHYLQFLRPNFFPDHSSELSIAQPWREYFNKRATNRRENHV
ncbi:MAG: metal-dependent hydrolase [Rhodocyclaceae bacterium]|nr:metal-dependent hydrolase [Rhodocyclaceae bacterium]